MDRKAPKARPNVKVLSDENLPLRGFLLCPDCGGFITGSASKGRSHRYYYYHCKSPCKYRFRADVVNNKFIEILKELEMRESVKKYLAKLMVETFKDVVDNPVSERKKILSEIDRLQSRLKLARNKLLEEVIDDEEYSEIKQDCKIQIEKLEKKLDKESDTKKVNLPKLLDQSIAYITNVGKLYTEGDIGVKREIIGSIFPEKLQFDGITYRTARPNILLSYIFQINNELGAKKNRRKSELSPFSGLVPNTNQISNHFIEDLERISNAIVRLNID